MFGISVGTYLVSKELFILEHEYYNGISLLIIYVTLIKLYGHKAAAYLDKEIDKQNEALESTRTNEIKANENQISHEQQQQWNIEGQKMIMDIKKENVKMQLEGTYRERMMQVYKEV